MKKFEYFKLFQFTFFILYSLMCCMALLDARIKSYIFSNTPATFLFFSVWILLLCNFIFIFIDYKLLVHVKSGSHILYDAAFADQLTSIPNRLSCDTIIEKYQSCSLPENFSCALFEITNLQEINQLQGHKKGNVAIKQFSSILISAAGSDGFVGRNGGNVFLAFFEYGNPERLRRFLHQVSSQVKAHNQKPNAVPILYRYGSATNHAEHPYTINQLISLANKAVQKQ